MSGAEATTVYTAFRDVAAAHASRPMLDVTAVTAARYDCDPVTYSFAAAARRIDGLREAFAAAGFGAGDRVALLLENRPEFFFHFLALNGLGSSIVPIHHEMAASEIAYRLGHSDVCLVVSLPVHHDLARAAIAACRREIPLVALDDDLPQPGRFAGAEPAVAGEAAIVYTSGSTGQPKGCILSNEYFLLLGHWYIDEGGLMSLSPAGERLITPLPLSHMNALACSFMAMMLSGGCLIQLDRFHPSSWWQAVREAEASIVHYLGVMPAILLNMPAQPDDDHGGQVRFGFGAGVDPRHHLLFEQRFGFPLIEGWAMTETGSGACIVASREPRNVEERCFGKAPARLEYRIVAENGADVADTGPGELLVRAAGNDPRRGFFSGYLKDPAATDEAWAGGWFHTGDVVRIGPHGSFFFVDRSKNIVRRSGENIAAVEVEGALLALASVAACAVAPVADELRGEEVMACIVPAPGVAATETSAGAICAALRESLAYFKLPGYIAFVDELPLTSSEKLQRGRLKSLCAELVTSGEALDLRDQKRRDPVAGRSAGDSRRV